MKNLIFDDQAACQNTKWIIPFIMYGMFWKRVPVMLFLCKNVNHFYIQWEYLFCAKTLGGITCYSGKIHCDYHFVLL